MDYILLMFLIIIFIFFWYMIFNKEFISPTIISYVAYFICTLFAFLGLGHWNDVYNLDFKLILIILLGLFSFGIGEFIYRIFHQKKVKTKEIVEIKVSNWKNVLSICFILMTIILCYMEIKKVCNSYGFYSNSVSALLSFYRNKTALFSSELLHVGLISTLVNQLKKVAYILSIVYIYIFTNNLVNKQNLKKQMPNLIVIGLSLILGFLSSGRFEIFKYLMAMFFSYFIIIYEKLGNKAKKKIIKTIIIAIIIIIPCFYYILPLLGRSTNSNMFDYITFYFGCSIPSFDRYLEVSHVPTHFGEESLYGIQMLLYKFNLSDYTDILSREWTFFTNDEFGTVMGSNVYTSFRRFFNDFGYMGVVLCQMLFGYIFTLLYKKARHRNNVRSTIFYLAFVYMLVDQIRDDLFMTRFFHINTIIYIILIYVITWFIFKFKVRSR